MLIAILGLVFGLIGTILGAISAWRIFNRDRVRVSVKSGIAFQPNTGHRLTVTISNSNAFPVTVIAAGFELKTFGKVKERFQVMDLDDPDKKLPYRLESWDEITVMSMPLTYLKVDIDSLSFPYAELAGGEIFRSKDMDAVQSCIKLINEAREKGTEPKPDSEQQPQQDQQPQK
jgi:hypothetical protein